MIKRIFWTFFACICFVASYAQSDNKWNSQTSHTNSAVQSDEGQITYVKVSFEEGKTTPVFENVWKLIELLEKHGNLGLQIEMPWCVNGYNSIELIKNRGQKISDYFVSSGIDKHRISLSILVIDVEDDNKMCDNGTANFKIVKAYENVVIEDTVAEEIAEEVVEEEPISMWDRTVPDGYVDLGLPSGTQWKSSNESGFYSFDDANRMFGSKLPSFDQWLELTKYCKWSWTGSGYRVTATNGNFIVLPALGSSNCDGSAIGACEYGDYWVSDHSDDIWYDFVFDELENEHFDSGDNPESFGCISVRLIWSK